MGEEKPKVSLIGGGSTKNFGVTDMQTYRNFETDEVTSSPPLNKVFTIENHRTDFEYLSGREKRRQRRKQQRKNG
jgi:hypothetical protein